MKKEYIQPQTSIVIAVVENPVMNVSATQQGISYGGVDEAGEKDPDAREMSPLHYNVWDD